MDFLLKAEQIVIETKMARAGRDAQKICKELIVDAASYKGHPGLPIRKVSLCLGGAHGFEGHQAPRISGSRTNLKDEGTVYPSVLSLLTVPPSAEFQETSPS